MSQSGPSKKSGNSLIALSSAAVLAVYTAGFMRTRAAAEHLEALEARVRPGMTASRGEAPAPPETPAAGPAAPTTIIAERPAEPPAAPPAIVVTKAEAAKVAVPAAAPAKLPDAPAAETKSETKTEAAVVHPAAVVAEVPAPAPPPPPVEVPAPPPAPAAPPQPTWKDGTYLGWGSARHGSIQASVEVTGGHIAVAKIEQCQMRYSCNVIERLIPQVAQRGNPEKIDYISGATESSNVFYWALIDALSKAK